MIEAIRKYPAIYDKGHSLYSKKLPNLKAWEAVAKKVLEVSGIEKTGKTGVYVFDKKLLLDWFCLVDVLQTRWRSVKNSLAKSKTRPTGSAAGKPCKYERACAFLESVQSHRR